MSDKMRQIEYEDLLDQVLVEYKRKGTLFYVPVIKRENHFPIGPAAGPHTQLAQNIIAAYAGGARYFELKTVQVIDGENLGIVKPCIYVSDEAYNTEWSTELTSNQALEEYIKAWYLLKVLIKEFDLGDENGFVFNMSVGYNLEGIQSQKIDYFIENMKDAYQTPIFLKCKNYTLENIDRFQNISLEYIEQIDSKLCDTISISTMHGCPVEAIEKIATYLLAEKKLNVYIKCNPTLLGFEEVRRTLDKMGYGYVAFDHEIFDEDLSFEAAVHLIKKLQNVAKEINKEFGVKLTNTFPVKITNNELVGEDMYMSGPSLYPLSIGVAAKLSEAFQGALKISYSGGADNNNIAAIYETGIQPITVSTLLLKPNGYKNLFKLNQALDKLEPIIDNKKINVEKLMKLAQDATTDNVYYKPKAKRKKILNEDYTVFCSLCKNCVDVCPNRANILIEYENEKYTIHKDALCNECGNCTHFCIAGHQPYKEKFTVFKCESDFDDSKNPGIYKTDQVIWVRYQGEVYKDKQEALSKLSDNVKEMIRQSYS
jgi:putative selenate reductase